MDHRTSGTFSCRKTDMVCLKDRKQHKKGLLSSWKVQKHSSGDRSKGKASSQRDPQAQHSSYLSSAALCAKVLALVQHTRRCHCRQREPYVSNLSANPCSERLLLMFGLWCSVHFDVESLFVLQTEFCDGVKLQEKTPKLNKTQHKLLSLCCFI